MRKANAAGRRQCNFCCRLAMAARLVCSSPKEASRQRTTEDNAQATDLWKECLGDARGQKAAVGSEGWVREKKEEKKVCRGICGSASQGEGWTRFVCVCGINFSRFSGSAKRNGGDRARYLNNWHCTGARRWQFGGGAPGLRLVGLREYKSVAAPDCKRGKSPEVKGHKESGNFKVQNGMTPGHSEARARVWVLPFEDSFGLFVLACYLHSSRSRENYIRPVGRQEAPFHPSATATMVVFRSSWLSILHCCFYGLLVNESQSTTPDLDLNDQARQQGQRVAV